MNDDIRVKTTAVGSVEEKHRTHVHARRRKARACMCVYEEIERIKTLDTICTANAYFLRRFAGIETHFFLINYYYYYTLFIICLLYYYYCKLLGTAFHSCLVTLFY